MRLALGLCLAASGAVADPLGFVNYDIVGAPYVDKLVDMGDGISVAPAEDGLVLVRVDTGAQFICDPRKELALGTAMMAMVELESAEGRGCLAFASIDDIMTSVNLRRDVIAAYAVRLGPDYDDLDVEERFIQAVQSTLRTDVPCTAYPVDFLQTFTNPDYVARVAAAIQRDGLPVQNCPEFVEFP